MGTKYNPSVVRDGLMIYLDAANKTSYPGTGNTWYDLKRNRNFTLQNSPPFVPDAAGVGDVDILGVKAFFIFFAE